MRAPRKAAPPREPSEEQVPAPATLETDGKGGHADLREANSPVPVYSPGAGPANVSHCSLSDENRNMMQKIKYIF